MLRRLFQSSVTRSLLSLVVVIGVFASTPTSAADFRRDEKCALSVADVPTVRGFRLGMGVGELENHYQGLRVAAPNARGYTEVVLFVSIDSYSRDVEDGRGIAMIKRSSFSEWKGVEKMVLKFIDGRLADYTILYKAGEPDWRSADEFAANLSASLNLPRSWKKQGDSVRVLKCGDINITATVERYSGSSGGILQVTELSAFRLLQSRAEASERRRAEDEEKQRRVFKP